jgi:predicted metalloprotease
LLRGRLGPLRQGAVSWSRETSSGLTAASGIGDDRLQQQSRGYVRPESFTHGSSAQRVGMFRTGFESGDVKRCDTFATQRG